MHSSSRPLFGGIAQTNPAKPSKKAPLTRGLAPEWATGGSLGITLIALIITIIVLLILAGVTINLTIGERGIFTTAQRAAQNYKDAQERELAELGEFENLMNNTINGLVGSYPNSNVKLIASEVEFNPADTSWSVTDVEQALTSIYNIYNAKK